MTPESQVLKFIKDFFSYDRGIYLTRRNAGTARKGNYVIKVGEAGESDYFGTIDYLFCPKCGKKTDRGVSLYIEAKSAKGRLTEQQREFLGHMTSLGAVAIVARPIPDKYDPTGFSALRAQLNAVRERICLDCQEREDNRNRKKEG